MSVTINTNKKIQAMLDAILKQNYEIQVGVLSKPDSNNSVSGDAKKTNKKKNIKSNKTVAEVAAIHEFGLGITQRSFLFSTVAERKEKWTEQLKKLLKNVTSEADYVEKIKLLAIKMQSDVRRKFTANDWAPVKRGGTPLVDSGQLRRAISWSVKKGSK